MPPLQASPAVGALAARVVVGDIEALVDCVAGVFDGLAFAGESGFGVGGVERGVGSMEWQAFAAWSSAVGDDVVIGIVCMVADVRFLGLDRLRYNKSDKNKFDSRKNNGKMKNTCVDNYGFSPLKPSKTRVRQHVYYW